LGCKAGLLVGLLLAVAPHPTMLSATATDRHGGGGQ